MPVNRLNNPILNSRNDFKVFEEQLQAGLERTIVHVLENRHEVHEKAKQCLEDKNSTAIRRFTARNCSSCTKAR